jgi:hypothetical protein
MVYLLAILVTIPVILAIVTVLPTEHKTDLPAESVDDVQQFDLRMLFFMLMIIWIVTLARILYLVRKGNYNVRTKF